MYMTPEFMTSWSCYNEHSEQRDGGKLVKLLCAVLSYSSKSEAISQIL
jgi:hypothetical protein